MDAAPRPDLSTVLAQAALAPSSHNCQPWRITGFGPGSAHPASDLLKGSHRTGLAIDIDSRRKLSSVPTLEREMRLSVGAFSAALLHLMRHAGWDVHATIQSSGDADPSVVLTFPQAMDAGHADPAAYIRLADLLARRRTERSHYCRSRSVRIEDEPRVLPLALGSEESLPRLHWQRIDDPGQLADFYGRCASRELAHEGCWRELYAHLRFGSARQPGDGTGIAIEQLMGPLSVWHRRFLQGVLHPRGLALGGRFVREVVAERFERALASLVRETATLYFLCAAPGRSTVVSDLIAGQEMIDLWLRLTAAGQGMHPLSVALQHDDLRSELGHALGCREEILFIARAGAPLRPAAAHCRRRRAAWFGRSVGSPFQLLACDRSAEPEHVLTRH